MYRFARHCCASVPSHGDPMRNLCTPSYIRGFSLTVTFPNDVYVCCSYHVPTLRRAIKYRKNSHCFYTSTHIRQCVFSLISRKGKEKRTESWLCGHIRIHRMLCIWEFLILLFFSFSTLLLIYLFRAKLVIHEAFICGKDRKESRERAAAATHDSRMKMTLRIIFKPG